MGSIISLWKTGCLCTVRVRLCGYDRTWPFRNMVQRVCIPLPHTWKRRKPASGNHEFLSRVPQTTSQGPIFYMHFKPGYDVEYSCPHCQLVCYPDFEVRTKRYNMVTTSGVVMQDDVGVCRAVSPHEAEKKSLQVWYLNEERCMSCYPKNKYL